MLIYNIKERIRIEHKKIFFVGLYINRLNLKKLKHTRMKRLFIMIAMYLKKISCLRSL